MNKRIAAHVDMLFAQTPLTPRAREIKEELLANLYDKYQDLLAAGQSKEEAYAQTVSGIGDIEMLLDGYQKNGPAAPTAPLAPAEEGYEQERKKAVGSLWWISMVFIYLAVSFYTGRWGYTWIIFLIGAFLQTLVSLRHVAVGQRDIVKLRELFWSGVVVIYLLVSFVYHAWGWSWMIFLASAILWEILRLTLFLPKDRRKAPRA